MLKVIEKRDESTCADHHQGAEPIIVQPAMVRWASGPHPRGLARDP
jgi:hypothetical protein